MTDFSKHMTEQTEVNEKAVQAAGDFLQAGPQTTRHGKNTVQGSYGLFPFLFWFERKSGKLLG